MRPVIPATRRKRCDVVKRKIALVEKVHERLNRWFIGLRIDGYLTQDQFYPVENSGGVFQGFQFRLYSRICG